MNIMIPIIRVRDKESGTEHIVGTNSHDKLIIEGNAVHYLNIQCMCGTNGGEYEFSGVDDNEYEPYARVEFVTLEEFASLYEGIIKEQNENEMHLQELLKKALAEMKKGEDITERKDYIWHT